MSFDPTGYTLAHEHLHIDLSGFKNNVDCRLDQYAFICQEMNDLMARGVRNVIEMTNRYMGRNVQFMLDVMRETGINVVACTGYYQDAFFPEHVATRSVQELAQEMVDEIEQGIDGTDLKAGIIAEIGSSEGKITPLEEKVFGVFWHKVLNRKIPLVRGFDDVFLAPHSRHTETPIEKVRADERLTILAESEEAGLFLAMAGGGRQIFVMGHPEYDRVTLDQEYKRDLSKGLKIRMPENYYPEDDPKIRPLLTWRATANNLYTNWLNYYVYQTTPYDLSDLGAGE